MVGILILGMFIIMDFVPWATVIFDGVQVARVTLSIPGSMRFGFYWHMLMDIVALATVIVDGVRVARVTLSILGSICF
jgi:hypothetical protein